MDREFSIMTIFLFIRNKIKIILAVAVVCAAVALLLSWKTGTTTYTYSGKLIVSNFEGTADSNSAQADLTLAQQVLPTYEEILRSKTFVAAVKKQADLPYSDEEIASMMNISSVEQTKILDVSITAPSAAHAKTLTQTILDLAPTYLQELVGMGTVKIVDNAGASRVSQPNLPVNTVLGFFAGAVVALLVLYIIEILDVRIKGESDVEARYDIPVLGVIPSFTQTSKRR